MAMLHLLLWLASLWTGSNSNSAIASFRVNNSESDLLFASDVVESCPSDDTFRAAIAASTSDPPGWDNNGTSRSLVRQRGYSQSNYLISSGTVPKRASSFYFFFSLAKNGADTHFLV